MKNYILIFLLILTFPCLANEEIKCDQIDYYAFSWPLIDRCDNKPRGGSSQGVDVKNDPAPHSGWLALNKDGLNKKEKDRLAILAMAGPYRVDFNFIETVGFSEHFQRDRPYHSWGTEYIYVLSDQENFISLQHIMVMYFKTAEGVSEPMVMKHWRQDWTYEDSSLLTYDHHNQWYNTETSKEQRQGRWSQAVFQVDDSPRYEAMGEWQHFPSYSTWISDKTNRPLPRREYSVRDDYQVLSGYNRHTINRFGWVQEEENWKQQINSDGELTGTVAKEEGIGRYQRIIGTDFSPGDQYMKRTGLFWTDVRNIWKQIISKNKHIKLLKKVDGQPLFMPMFAYASKLDGGEDYDPKDARRFISETINKYIK